LSTGEKRAARYYMQLNAFIFPFAVLYVLMVWASDQKSISFILTIFFFV
jgi:hypothetical protein